MVFSQKLENAKEDECVKLLHTIYGLVQSTLQFWKKLLNGLKNMGFKGGYPDPCLMWGKKFGRDIHSNLCG